MASEVAHVQSYPSTVEMMSEVKAREDSGVMECVTNEEPNDMVVDQEPSETISRSVPIGL